MASGGAREFVRNGVEGYLVDSDRTMAAAATGLLLDPAALAGIQTHNRSSDPVMTWEAVVSAHLRLYQEVSQTALSVPLLASGYLAVPTSVELDR
jgi:hypothetical protein